MYFTDPFRTQSCSQGHGRKYESRLELINLQKARTVRKRQGFKTHERGSEIFLVVSYLLTSEGQLLIYGRKRLQVAYFGCKIFGRHFGNLPALHFAYARFLLTPRSTPGRVERGVWERDLGIQPACNFGPFLSFCMCCIRRPDCK